MTNDLPSSPISTAVDAANFGVTAGGFGNLAKPFHAMTHQTQSNPVMKKTNLLNIITGIAVGLMLANSATAADVVKTNNADNLNLGTSWVGGVVPGAADVAVWNNIVGSPNTTVLGANLAWAGLRIADPIGLVTISAGSFLTNGAGGIDMTAATSDLTLNCGVAIAPGVRQTWNVAPGRTLTVAAVPTKPGQPSNNTGMLRVGNTGTVFLGTGTVPLVLDNQNNPWVTFGANDWAALNAGQVVAATYTDATTSLVAGANNNVVADLTGANGVDVASLRFNDPTPRNVTVANSSTSRTLTARGILVTENSGGGGIIGNAAASFLRMNRVTVANTAFNVIQNSPADFTIAANISNGSSGAPTHLVKQGNGNLIIAHTGNGFSGGTDVNAGTLTVAAGASLGGGAVVVNQGKLAINSGTTLLHAGTTLAGGTTAAINVTSANGQVTLTNNLTFNAGTSTLEFVYNAGVAPSATAAPLVVSNLTANATINVKVLSGSIAVGQYPLVKYVGAFGGLGFAAFNPTVTLPPRVVATLSNNTANASIDLVVTAVNSPITWTASSATWDLSAVNWRDAVATPTAYQQVSGLGDSVVFEESLSGAGPITVTLNTTVAPAAMTVSNVTKAYTLSGSGSVSGIGGLTKRGAGTLTLATVNSFSGGVNLNGGTTVFSALANLGTGGITFGGGTLQYNGNADDLSVRTVTFASGGATLDVGASTVNFANAVGNNGAGGLTKLGAGSLTLNGANTYSGTTLVNQGNLILASGATLPNSTILTVSGSATLDASASGLILSAAASQKLAGNGTVLGDVTSGASTALTPGTSAGTLTLANNLTISGGTYTYDVSTNTAGRDLIVVNGNLTLTSGTLQVVASGNLTNGLYRLIDYSGALTGGAANLVISGFSQAGKIATLEDNIPNQINLRIATAGGAAKTWAGLGTDWDVENAFNWNAGAATYVNGDFVTFNDSGAAQPNVNLVGSLVPGGIVVNATADYTLSSSSGGLLSGATGIAKSGTGKLTVLTPNNNVGATVINGGTVQVGDGVTTGHLGSGNITNNGSLNFQQPDSRSINGVLAGSGSLTQQGGATLTLAGEVPYTGPTVISSGTLQVGTGGAAGVMSTAGITNDSLLILNSSSSWTLAAPVVGTGAVTKQGAGTLTLTGVKTYTGRTSGEGGLLKLGAANQVLGELRIQTGGTVDLNGFNQTVPLFTSTTFAGGVLTNTASAQTNTLTVDNAATSDSSVAIVDGAAGGVIKLVKTGVGELILRGANSFSGGTVISNGTLNVSGGTALGTGSLTLHNGTTLNDRTSFWSNPVHTAAGATATILSSALGNSLSGALTSGDANTTNLISSGISFSANTLKQFQGFTGTVQVGVAGTLRFSSSTLAVNGGDNTTFALEGPIQTRNGTGTAAGNGIYLGAVSDVPGSFFPGALRGADAADGLTTYYIGGKGLSTAFSGSIEGTAPRATAIVKTGAGSLTLSGSLLYDGNTTVNSGSLVLTGSAELDDSPAIAVNAGTLDVSGIGGVLNLGSLKAQTLSGAGTVNGAVTAIGSQPATIAPGATLGTLTVSGAVTMAPNSVTIMELNRTNAPATNDMLVAAAITADGALTVTNLGPALQAGDTFKLFSVPVTGFTSVVLPPTFVQNGVTNNYVWTNRLAIDGTIRVLTGLVPVNTTPTNITSSITGGNLTMSWPTDHTGWRLEVQTNSLSVGIANNWSTVAGSASTNSVTLPVNPANPAVFFRLVYP